MMRSLRPCVADRHAIVIAVSHTETAHGGASSVFMGNVSRGSKRFSSDRKPPASSLEARMRAWQQRAGMTTRGESSNDNRAGDGRQR